MSDPEIQSVETRLRQEILRMLQKGMAECEEDYRKGFFREQGANYFAAVKGDLSLVGFKDMIAYAQIMGILTDDGLQPLLRRLRMTAPLPPLPLDLSED